MTAVVLDRVEAARFEQLTAEIEVWDASGRMLGYFIPKAVYERKFRERANKQIMDEGVEGLGLEA